ncbi:pelargonidin 3-o-(6-caffeoylglucoside) 5-o-(6-o-malonylglucoside) 4'''-malonyltransferase [Phtheirospermum japonicum]|uniref:Pelargonidin 3-o-(6-caffeoylglucoside) 5-o-(6-o-malonylglucoside) 4'''-malonyltransferase n=1 Tax=Phtheirospermum japonicum TaxID=374723 RepID=A0A830BE68_9LAMI|nr:pelargonidin 3-o-(6-caffeoylglucoside) 5-o-(6-o-malonylglucoside) 4'''-malonyltransferase [Phtheirospermum japonicum]
MGPANNMNIILFYPPNLNPNQNPITSHLQESLAKILPQFYPFAGRYIKKDHMVDCNDEGAEFVEAEANDIELMDFIAKTKNHQLNDLVSLKLLDADKPQDPLLSVQITHFKCGGLSICVSMSHRISDGSTLGTFIAAWSNANNNNPEPVMPSFDSPSLFPGINLEYDLKRPSNPTITKRLLFNKEAISSLEAILSFRSQLRAKNEKGYLSRVRVVSAVIAKALIGVEIAKYDGKSREYFIGQAVNIRERTIPPLHKHSCGNLSLHSIIQCMAENETNEIGLQDLVNKLGESIDKTINDCAELLSAAEDRRMKIILDPLASLVKKFESGDLNAMAFSDWSKFGFYEADFGSGNKPVWLGSLSLHGENITILIGNKEGDGVEAWVQLNPNDVPYFEQDEDIKLYTIA